MEGEMDFKKESISILEKIFMTKQSLTLPKPDGCGSTWITLNSSGEFIEIETNKGKMNFETIEILYENLLRAYEIVYKDCYSVKNTPEQGLYIDLRHITP
jgi:hypothetical protein